MVQKKIKPCWTANDVEGQENQRDNTIQKANNPFFSSFTDKTKAERFGQKNIV